MFDQLRVQRPERIDQPAVGGETTVEVVFEFDEEAVARLMVGFENVQLAQEHRLVSRSRGGEQVVERVR
ncbi:hypothetical protein IU486_20020 [Streptomyces gardneri]|uniref:hypothetical protein n=1 Tax=Nocardia TaxID=1817 RepID=UPI00135C83CA|nr:MULTISPECIES: hypothetical protein [Nocardia]MBF6167016.1 hypothetical protein [Streptomyces gardneri]MBF6204064.1 hypothetical protein [Streptomyces gardneri]